MTNSLRGSSKVAIFALIATLSIPSSAVGFGEDLPDETLTVLVNMSPGGSGGENGCTGFATVALSNTELVSSLDENRPGVSNPSIQQRLQPYGLTTTEESGNGTDPAFFRVGGQGDWMIHRDWASRNELLASKILNQTTRVGDGELILVINSDDFDGSYDLTISPSISSIAMVDRRSYATEPFTLTYDASSCVSDLTTRAYVEVERSALQVRSQNGPSSWREIETDAGPDTSPQDMLDLAAAAQFSGHAFLLRTTQPLGGTTINREFAEYFDDGADEIASGTAGETTLRAITKLYGDLSENGQFRTQYGFWMNVYQDD